MPLNSQLSGGRFVAGEEIKHLRKFYLRLLIELLHYFPIKSTTAISKSYSYKQHL